MIVAVRSINNSFKKIMFWLTDSLLPNQIYFISETFLAQTSTAYYATMTSSLRAIRRKSKERILEIYMILLLLFNYSIKILNYYIAMLLKYDETYLFY